MTTPETPVTPVPFGRRLRAAMDRLGPLCVGIDPHPALLGDWGLSDDVTGLSSFADTCVEALAGRVAVVKPQSAFFERHGSRGLAVLEDVLKALREKGTLTLLDVKRGDIGSTMQAYAEAYLLDGSPLAADAITCSPYLGVESLRPALDLARGQGRGVFVLALTSNPEGSQVQHAVSADGRSVAAAVVEAARAENLRDEGAPGDGLGGEPGGASPLGSVGLVVGATVGSAVNRLGLDLAASRAPLLAPGVGAQGAGADELREVFGASRSQVLASTSREVLRGGPTVAGVAAAAERARDAVVSALR